MKDTILRLRALIAMMRSTYCEWREMAWDCDLDAHYCCPGDPMRDECGCGGMTNRELIEDCILPRPLKLKRVSASGAD